MPPCRAVAVRYSVFFHASTYTMLFHQLLRSPIGLLHLCSDENALLSVGFVDAQPELELTNGLAILEESCRQLNAYFEGGLTHFDLPLAPKGTVFQQEVWTELQKVAFGSTQSYLQFTRSFTDEKAIRAVAAANGKNPIALIIPCHRIIGSKGDLVGYAGELWRKKWLLGHEKKVKGADWQLF